MQACRGASAASAVNSRCAGHAAQTCTNTDTRRFSPCSPLFFVLIHSICERRDEDTFDSLVCSPRACSQCRLTVPLHVFALRNTHTHTRPLKGKSDFSISSSGLASLLMIRRSCSLLLLLHVYHDPEPFWTAFQFVLLLFRRSFVLPSPFTHSRQWINECADVYAKQYQVGHACDGTGSQCVCGRN